MKRIDALIVQAIVTEYDANGRQINEGVLQPQKVFLTNLQDIFAALEAENARLADGEKTKDG